MKIAIVEDDINMRKSLEFAMEDYPEFEVKTFKSAKDVLKKLDDSFDLVVTDINMPGMDGLELVEVLGGKYEVIIMTGNATLQRAIESIKQGVKDFLIKPFEIETLIKAIKRSHKIQTLTKDKPKTKKAKDNDLIAISPSTKKVLNILDKASKTDVSILLLGQSGVGKEVFSQYIHKNSSRSKKPFIAINMAAIPDNLIESELFGFEKGAFTDANEQKIGQFEQAQDGTLFLDEIGEMPYNLQAKLLRVIQEKKIRRLGGKKDININIRIVSATNANLEEKIQNGLFREDLYYRLNTIPVTIPSLKDRVEEIIPIAQLTLKRVKEQYGFSEKSFSEEAKEELLKHKWRGNIRQLISTVERAVILSEEIITKEDLFLDNRL
jgi:two-component system NtrC family response regulator